MSRLVSGYVVVGAGSVSRAVPVPGVPSALVAQLVACFTS
jgi:hypothetical protein